MKALMLLANGFEDTEGLTTRDVLIRGGIEVVTASITSHREVISSFGIHLFVDEAINEINPKEFDAIILPGGGRGTANLMQSEPAHKLVLSFASDNKLICAICAAPMVFGHLGLLKDKKYTCFAGCNAGIDGNFTANEVEVDGNIITARSMHYSIPFALAILEKLCGKDVKEKVLVGLKGLTEK